MLVQSQPGSHSIPQDFFFPPLHPPSSHLLLLFWGEGNLTHVCHVIVIRSTSTHPSHSSPSLLFLPPLFFSEFPCAPFTNPPNPLSALMCAWWRAIYWSVGGLSGATVLKKSDSPPSVSSISSGRDRSFCPLPCPCWGVIWLGFVCVVHVCNCPVVARKHCFSVAPTT